MNTGCQCTGRWTGKSGSNAKYSTVFFVYKKKQVITAHNSFEMADEYGWIEW